MSERICSLCKEVKPLELFEKDKRRKDGRGVRCRQCKLFIPGNSKPYKAFWRLKAKQKLYNIPIEITKEDVAILFDVFEGKCSYCGIDESEETGTMELDHVVPMSRGGRHHVSNFVISCKSCNAKKRDKQLVDFYRCHKPFTGERLDYIFKHIAYFTKRDPEEVALEFYAEAKERHDGVYLRLGGDRMSSKERGVSVVKVGTGEVMTVYKLRKMSMESIRKYGLEGYVMERVSDE